jgi:hypothetical protein
LRELHPRSDPSLAISQLFEALALERVALHAHEVRFVEDFADEFFGQAPQRVAVQVQVFHGGQLAEDVTVDSGEVVPIEEEIAEFSHLREGVSIDGLDFVVAQVDIDRVSVLPEVLEGVGRNLLEEVVREGNRRQSGAVEEPVTVPVLQLVEIKSDGLQGLHVVKSSCPNNRQLVVRKIEILHLDEVEDPFFDLSDVVEGQAEVGERFEVSEGVGFDLVDAAVVDHQRLQVVEEGELDLPQDGELLVDHDLLGLEQTFGGRFPGDVIVRLARLPVVPYQVGVVGDPPGQLHQHQKTHHELHVSTRYRTLMTARNDLTAGCGVERSFPQ